MFTYASNVLIPGSGAFLEGGSMAIDATATGAVIVDSLVHPPAQMLMELIDADPDCEEPKWILQMLFAEQDLLMNLARDPYE